MKTYWITMELLSESGAGRPPIVVKREILLDPMDLDTALDAWKEFEAAAAEVWEKALFD